MLAAYTGSVATAKKKTPQEQAAQPTGIAVNGGRANQPVLTGSGGMANPMTGAQKYAGGMPVLTAGAAPGTVPPPPPPPPPPVTGMPIHGADGPAPRTPQVAPTDPGMPIHGSGDGGARPRAPKGVPEEAVKNTGRMPVLTRAGDGADGMPTTNSYDENVPLKNRANTMVNSRATADSGGKALPSEASRPSSQGATQWNQEYADWVRQMMGKPSRYDAKLVKQGLKTIDADINRERKEGTRALEEYYASRGLTGASLEAEQMGAFEGQLQELGDKRKFELGREQAMTWANDMNVVGSLGLGAGQMLNEREAMELADERARMSLRLQKQGMNQAAADREADRQMQKEMEEARMGWDREKWRENMELEYGGLPTSTASSSPKSLPAAPAAGGSGGGKSEEKLIEEYMSGYSPHAGYQGQIWDQFASKYGRDVALATLGPRMQ